MAFSFGTSTFGAASTPAFGAPAATPAFGASSAPAPAFGAASAPSLFGASSAPAFGAPTAAQAATPAPAFGAPAPAASPFGATTFGATAASQPAQNLFGSTTPAFGGGLFGQPASQPATSTALVPFGAQPAQQQAQQARPAGLNYKTKFEELPPQMQQELQKIQQEISSYRDECRALDNDTRLHDAVGIKQSLDSETSALRQTLQSLYQAAVADGEGLIAFREKVMVLLRSTETAIRLYQRSRMWREVSQSAGGSGASAAAAQQALVSQALQEQVMQPVQLPNPYLAMAVRSFHAALEQYHRCISELERVIGPSLAAAGGGGGLLAGGGFGGGGGAEEVLAVQSLPLLVSRMHDYFVHVAARLDKLHGEVTRAREAYLAQRRAVGDLSDPFADARPLHHLAAAPGSRPTRGPLSALSSLAHGAAPAAGGGAASGQATSQPAAPAASTATGGTTAPAAGGGLFGGLASPSPFGGGVTSAPFGTPLGAAGQPAAAAQRSGSSKKR